MQPISHSLPYEKDALPWVGIKLRRPDMAERKWTPEQKQCIEARGGTVLVSAAAGSGKTSVLVQRLVGRITDRSIRWMWTGCWW